MPPTEESAITGIAAPPDPFAPAALRLNDDDLDLGIREVCATVPFRKPSPEEFFRVHPGHDRRCFGRLLEMKDDSEFYWVTPEAHPYVADELRFAKRLILTCVNRAGTPFLWGCRLPGADGKVMDWMRGPLEAAKAAETKWTRLVWDQAQRRHRVKVAHQLPDDPVWPTESLSDLLRVAFRDRTIDGPDHPVLKKLRGEV